MFLLLPHQEQELDIVQYAMHYGCVSSQVTTIHYYADYKKTAPSVMNEYWPGWNKRLVESGLYGHEKGQIDTMGKCEIIICNCLMKLLVKHISCSMKRIALRESLVVYSYQSVSSEM